MGDEANQRGVALEAPNSLRLWVERGRVRVEIVALEAETSFYLDVHPDTLAGCGDLTEADGQRLLRRLDHLNRDGDLMLEKIDRSVEAIMRGHPPPDERGPVTARELREWSEWFDNPNESPGIAVTLPARGVGGVPTEISLTPGFLLRRIAEAWEREIGEGGG